MIIADFYVGSKPVRRVYQGGKVIWFRPIPIPTVGMASSDTYARVNGAAALEYVSTFGFAQSASDAKNVMTVWILWALDGRTESASEMKAKASAFPLVHIEGLSTNDSDARARLRALPRLPFYGRGKQTSYGMATPETKDALSMHGLVDMTNYARADGHSRMALVLNGSAENYSYVNGIMSAFDLASLIGSSTSTTSVRAEMGACKLQNLSGSANAVTSARAYCDCFIKLSMLAVAENNSDGAATLNNPQVVRVAGFGNSDTYMSAEVLVASSASARSLSPIVSDCEAHGLVWDCIPMDARAESSSEAEAVLGLYPIASMDVRAESNVNALSAIGTRIAAVGYGNKNKIESDIEVELSLWYLPIVDGDTLEIRQVHNIIEEDDILEVI